MTSEAGDLAAATVPEPAPPVPWGRVLSLVATNLSPDVRLVRVNTVETAEMTAWRSELDPELEGARDRARQRLALAEAELSEARTELVRLRLAAAVAGGPQTSTVRLAGLEAAPQASGRTLVDPGEERAAFFAGGLTPAPEGSTYQLWLIVDGAPRSAGIFEVEGRAGIRAADAMLLVVNAVAGVEVTTEKVSVEAAIISTPQ